MNAQITRSDGFRIALEGINVTTFPMGTIVIGHVAQRAIECGAAIKIEQLATKVAGPDEVKDAPKPRRTRRKKAAD
jgi:hypothetical protein